MLSPVLPKLSQEIQRNNRIERINGKMREEKQVAIEQVAINRKHQEDVECDGSTWKRMYEKRRREREHKGEVKRDHRSILERK
jgi:hypothetical protein